MAAAEADADEAEADAEGDERVTAGDGEAADPTCGAEPCG